ncbi:hypothetical protein PIB30_112462, partial [Stylosanthes scabra]|nr:hypothetical protein [Stylosanthes scabra]
VLSTDLRRNIENLEKNSVTSLRTLVNLGSEVYLQAEVPNTQRIFVDVGLGFHVEFTWSEALNYIYVEHHIYARSERYVDLDHLEGYLRIGFVEQVEPKR